MRIFLSRLIATWLAVLVSGCSMPLAEIKPAQVAAIDFSTMDCKALSDRFKWISGRVNALTGYRQADNKGEEIKITWPPAFKYDNDPTVLAQLQALRGESDGLQTTAIGQRCPNLLWQETSPEFSLTSVPPATAGDTQATGTLKEGPR